MIPWSEQFEHLQARVMFGLNKLTLDWQLRASMPRALPQDIVSALELNQTGTRPLAIGSDSIETEQESFKSNEC